MAPVHSAAPDAIARMRQLVAGQFAGGVATAIEQFEAEFPGAGTTVTYAFASAAESPAFITAGLAAVTPAAIADMLTELPPVANHAAASHAAALIWAGLASPAAIAAVAAAADRLEYARVALGHEATAGRLALAFDSLAVLAGWL